MPHNLEHRAWLLIGIGAVGGTEDRSTGGNLMQIHAISAHGKLKSFRDEGQFLGAIDSLLGIGARFTVSVATTGFDVARKINQERKGGKEKGKEKVSGTDFDAKMSRKLSTPFRSSFRPRR